MSIYVTLAEVLFGSLLGLCVLHAIVSRIVRLLGYGETPPQTIALLTIMVSNIPVLYLAWDLVLKPLPAFDILCGAIYVLMTYNTCCFGYFWVLNVTETSLHVNILMRLYVEGRMPLLELAKRYSVKDIINARIDRMVAMGQLQERSGRYILADRSFLLIGRFFDTWRRVLGMPVRPAD
jgi:hypothetical protein